MPVPGRGRVEAERFVVEQLEPLIERRGGHTLSSPTVRGGQDAADAALARFDVTGYAAGHRFAYPQPRRVGSRLSPYLRHGLLSFAQPWDRVAAGPPADVAAFRRALLRAEYARHAYAAGVNHHGRTVGADTGQVDGGRPRRSGEPPTLDPEPGTNLGWNRRMGCIEIALGELVEDGWLVDEARRWLAIDWSVHRGQRWTDGWDHLFRHSIDGSQAVGSQVAAWLSGLAPEAVAPAPGDRPAGRPLPVFSRLDVERWAPGLCASCELVHRCPVEDSVDRVGRELGLRTGAGEPDPADLRSGLDELIGSDAARIGPMPPGPGGGVEPRGSSWAEAAAGFGPRRFGGPDQPLRYRRPDTVWLTAESLGPGDPAAAAHPELPVVFVFDRPLLTALRLSPKRLVFWVETLAELATTREVELWSGDPIAVLTGRHPATTYAPVPGWHRRAVRIDPAEIHPWPWLVDPHRGDPTTSFERWVASVAFRQTGTR
ncbi:MAG: deoxyribodipyrimidine photolyase [Acidimicrobiales bacterium]